MTKIMKENVSNETMTALLKVSHNLEETVMHLFLKGNLNLICQSASKHNSFSSSIVENTC